MQFRPSRYNRGDRLPYRRASAAPVDVKPDMVITMSGPQGCGKTRWAYRIAALMFDEFDVEIHDGDGCGAITERHQSNAADRPRLRIKTRLT